MKRMMLSVLGLLAGFMVNAKEVEQISVVESESVTVTVPFAVKSYAPSNKEVVRVEELGGTSLRVTALKKGRCDLDVMGDNGLHQKYEIQVVGDLASLLESLTQDLDSVPEVNAEIRGNFIRLDGEVNNIAKWEYLTKVLGNYGSGNNSPIKNYVKFYPGPEMLNRLKETFEQAKWKVQFKQFSGDFGNWPYKTVALDLNKKNRVLAVQAHCLNAKERNSILSILKGEPWLAVNIDDDWKKPVDVPAEKADYIITTMKALPIATPTIRLSVAYLAIADNDESKLGSENTLSLSGNFQYLYNLAKGETVEKTAVIGAAFDPTVSFMAESGESHISSKAYTLFKNWDEKGASFKSGGTFYVPITTRDVAELKEIEYGLDAKVKGGLVTPEKVELDLDMSFTKPVVPQNGGFDKKEEKSSQKLYCPLGKTLAIGGFGEVLDNKTVKGLPVLRNTPLLSWFVAQDGETASNRRLLILISPEIVDNATDGAIDVDREITIPVKTDGEKSAKQIVEERKPYSGWLYWLNWFTF